MIKSVKIVLALSFCQLVDFYFDLPTNSNLILIRRNMSRSFYSGFEEVVSRLLSLILTLVFFSIYISAKSESIIFLDWSKMLVFLGIFWLTTEVLSAILHFIFCQFSKNKLIVNEKKPEIQFKSEPTVIAIDKNLSDK